jgi:hypothetical protein
MYFNFKLALVSPFGARKVCFGNGVLVIARTCVFC